MVELLDEKDRKILLELDKDARQPDSEIAKKVKLSKQVTNYRIKKLREREIISNFYTIVNIGKLGLNSYYVFFQFKGLNKEKETKLLEKLKALNYIGWLVSGTGRWDAVALVYSDSLSNFDLLLNQMINICGNNLHEYTFTSLIEAEHISYKFLGEKYVRTSKQTEKHKQVILNSTDKKILSAISQDARLTTVEISEKSSIVLHKVRYHLQNLIRDQVIEGFKPKINVNKLGYQWHLLLMQLQNLKENRKEEFITFCKAHPKIYYITNTLGNYNLMLDVHVKSTEDFKETLLELKEKFSDIIKLHESIIIFDEYKIDYFPKSLLN